jgi:histidinol phosphatase-like enzyme
MLKIIFLDIDGVLLPFPNNDNKSGSSDDDGLFPPSTLRALHHLMRETTDAKLVLSSTWRVRKDYIHDILRCLRDYGMDIEAFYDITDPTMHSERQWEIQAWLSNKQEQLGADEPAIVWLAIDDEDLEVGDSNAKYRDLFHGHVVKTESSVGLTMEDVEEALKLWTAQL